MGGRDLTHHEITQTVKEDLQSPVAGEPRVMLEGKSVGLLDELYRMDS